MLSLLTLNVQAAGPARAPRLFDWLAARDEHLFVLTETSNGPGTALLLEQCRSKGWTVSHFRSSDGDRGVAVVSRIAAVAHPDLTAGISLPGRAVAVTVEARFPITVLGLYVPSSERTPPKIEKKRRFLSTTLAALDGLAERDRRRLVVVGDYNVISRSHQPRYSTFRQFEYEFLDRLNQLGLSDAHEQLRPGAQVYSWYGRGGNGYRFDYVHTGLALTESVLGCDYVQEPRTLGLSDHAAVTLTLDSSSIDRRLPQPSPGSGGQRTK